MRTVAPFPYLFFSLFIPELLPSSLTLSLPFPLPPPLVRLFQEEFQYLTSIWSCPLLFSPVLSPDSGKTPVVSWLWIYVLVCHFLDFVWVSLFRARLVLFFFEYIFVIEHVLHWTSGNDSNPKHDRVLFWAQLCSFHEGNFLSYTHVLSFMLSMVGVLLARLCLSWFSSSKTDKDVFFYR